MLLRSLALVSALAAAGCTSFDQSDYGQLFHYARRAWSGGGDTVELQQAAAVPYASIAIRIGDGPQQMLLLASDAGGNRLWTSSSHIVVATHDGRIVRTVGLTRNLSGLTFAPLAAGQSSGFAVQPAQTLLADFSDLNTYSVPIICHAHAVGARTITILGQSIRTDRVNEDCRSQALNWSFVNSYWLDPASGLVWRSIQHIHPDFATVVIETLRPPQS